MFLKIPAALALERCSGGCRPLIAGCISLQRFEMNSPITLHPRADPSANCAIGATSQFTTPNTTTT